MQEKESIMFFFVQTENSVTRDNCLALLSKPREAEQLPL